MASRGISYFGQRGHYISNIKKIDTKTNIVISKKNKWNKIDSNIRSYSGGASAHRDPITNFTMYARL